MPIFKKIYRSVSNRQKTAPSAAHVMTSVGVIVLMVGFWCGCQVTRYHPDKFGATRKSIQREPIIRVRIAQVTDRVLIDATDRVLIGPATSSVSGGRNSGTSAAHTSGFDSSQFRSFATPISMYRSGNAFVVESSDQRPVQWAISTVVIKSQRSGVVRIGGVPYPNQVVLQSATGGGWSSERFDVVNYTPIEQYLPGVLEKELFPNWHPTTFRVQAIAARSYAIDQIARNSQRHYDVESTVADQAYGGISDHAIAVDAVRNTRGVVLIYNDHVLPAYYSSCSGGVGQDAWVAFPDGPNIEALRGRQQGTMGASSPNYTWGPIERNIDVLSQRLARWGTANSSPISGIQGLRSIQVATRNSAGRPAAFRVIDQTGRGYVLAAESLRHALNYNVSGLPTLTSDRKVKSSFLRSEMDGRTVRLYGQGMGHGVGMCQWGAQGMAIRSQTVEQILGLYYPGADLVKAY